MRKPNAIIERLKISPCTADQLPYRPSLQKFSVKNRMLFQKIHISGHRYRKDQPQHRPFITVYYLLYDINIAVDIFVRINYDALATLDFTRNNHIHSGLPKGLAIKIIAEFKSQSKTFKVLTPKGL